MKTRKLKCSSCGADLEYNEDKQIIFCPYCGSKELVIEDDTRHIIANTYLKAKDKDNKHEEELEKIKQDNAFKTLKEDNKNRLIMIAFSFAAIIILLSLL